MILRTKIALCAGLLAFGVSASERALTQPVPPYYPGAVYPGPVYPGYAPGLPPHEIVAVVRSAGLDPLSRPMRRGPVYALLAVDHAGQEFRVTVDARLGRVLRIVPMPGARFAAPVVVPPTPYGRPPAGIAMVPDGYGPNSRIAALPPGGEGPPENAPGLAGVPTGPGHAPALGAAPRPAVHAGPPLPRPRPKLAATATDPSTSKPATGAASQVSQSRQAGTKETSGAVTPPPEE